MDDFNGDGDRRGGAGRGRGARSSSRRGGSQHVDAFHDELDSAISQRSSRAGLGSASRQQQSGGQFNRHKQSLNASGGRVPKFLADIVAASSESVRRQLPTSLVDGMTRAAEEEDDQADAGDEEARQRRDIRTARAMEQRLKEDGTDRPVGEDELPSIANLADYERHTAELTQLLGRAPPQQQAASSGEEQPPEKKEAESDLPYRRRQRLEDERADELERSTGQHVFRKSKSRMTTSAEQSAQPAHKRAKTANAAGSVSGSKLSFDDGDV